MKKTIKLSIIYFKEQIYNAFQGFNKKAKSRTMPMILLLFLLLSAAIGYSLYNIAETLNILDLSQNIIIVGIFMAFFISLMINLTDTQGVMYRAKDYDLLSSLPLKNISIISAKYLGSYLTSMLYYVLIAVPTFIVYFIFNKFSIFALLFALLSILFMPAFSQFITSVLGFLVNAITSRMKNKNIFRSIISLVFAIGLAVVISLSNNDMFSGLFSGGLSLWFKIVFSNIYFLFTAVTTSSFVYFLYALLVSIGFIILGVGVILLGYKKINSALMVTKTNGKPAPIVYKERSAYRNMFKKEISTFFNSPVYCVNGLIGIVMTGVVTAICLVTYSQMPIIDGTIIKDIFTIIMASCVAMCLGIAPTTSVTFSIEGSKLQTLKSLPIKFKDIILAKSSLNFMLSVPAIFICTIIFGIVGKISVLVIMLICVYLLLATISHTALGLIFNLKFPRLNWTSETQAVKNGASMILTMFLDMLASIVPMIIFFIWYSNSTWLTIEIFMSFLVSLQFAYSLTLVILLVKNGERMFNKIQV